MTLEDLLRQMKRDLCIVTAQLNDVCEYEEATIGQQALNAVAYFLDRLSEVGLDGFTYPFEENQILDHRPKDD